MGSKEKKITRVLKKQGMLEAKGSFLKIEPEKAQGCVSWTGVLGVEPGKPPGPTPNVGMPPTPTPPLAPAEGRESSGNLTNEYYA